MAAAPASKSAGQQQKRQASFANEPKLAAYQASSPLHLAELLPFPFSFPLEKAPRESQGSPAQRESQDPAVWGPGEAFRLKKPVSKTLGAEPLAILELQQPAQGKESMGKLRWEALPQVV